MLDVRRLEVLAAAVRERSIAAAARSLQITPSAASQAIAALERQAGTRLLERATRGVAPTAAGERLALRAEAVLAQLAGAEAELAQVTPGTLRVAAFPTAITGLLADALQTLRVQGPGLEVSLLEVEPEGARAALRAGAIDVALVNHDAGLAPDAQGPWRVVHVLDEPVLAAVPLKHRCAQQKTIDLAELATDDWIMQIPASPCQQLAVLACAAEGFAPTVSATCGDYRSIVRLVECGHGVSLVPRLAAQFIDGRGIALRPTRVPLNRRTNALIAAEHGTSPAVTQLLTALRQVSSRRSAQG